MVVVGIMVLAIAFIKPAFISLKTAGDVTGAAYTIKGILDQARTYAMANNTYTWVGFYEENGAIASTNPPTAGTGRLIMSVVASKDGTTIYNPNSTINPDPIDPAQLTQLGKLVKIDNLHLPLFTVGSGGTSDTFDQRPTLQNDPGAGYNDSRFGELNDNPTAPTTNSKFPFQYPVGNSAPPSQYTFRRTLQFNPRGEGSINSTYDVRRVIEIGMVMTHGSTAPTVFSGNAAALQLSGFSGTVKIYRR